MHKNYPMGQPLQGAYQPMHQDIHGLCQRYMNYHVVAQMNDGTQFDGILDGMDEGGVTILVAEDVMDDGEMRLFGYDSDYDDYDYDDYGRPRRRRFRRFRRRRFPINLFRFLFPYPYYTPYPYYGYGY
jgi:hypothetical protein